MRNRVSLTIVIVSVLTIQSTAQTLNAEVGFIGIVGLSTHSNLSDVNRTLVNNGLPQLANSSNVSEAGIGIWINRFHVSFLQTEFETKETLLNDYKSHIAGTGNRLILGYDILRHERARLYPYAGVALTNYDIFIDPVASTTFGGALANPSSLSAISTAINAEQAGIVGLGIDVKLFTFSKEKLSLGLSARGGYFYSSNTGEWRVNNQLITAPSSSLRGMEYRLAFQLYYKLSPRN